MAELQARPLPTIAPLSTGELALLVAIAKRLELPALRVRRLAHRWLTRVLH